jgi:hypothetical protein
MAFDSQSTKPLSSRVGIFVGVQSEILWRKLIATSEIKGLNVAIDREVVFQGQYAEYARRGWEEVQFHSQYSLSTPTRSQVVRVTGFQARPLNDRSPASTIIVLAFRSLRPAGGRILPPLLPPIDGQIE